MVPLFGNDVVTSRTDFRRDALCGQVLRLRCADDRDCGDNSDDDADTRSIFFAASLDE